MDLLDDWEEDARYNPTMGAYQDLTDVEETGLTDSGFVRATLDEETPIFSLHKLEWQPLRTQGVLRSLVTSNNVMVMVMDTNRVIRLNLDTYDADEVELSKRPEDAVYKAFLDPTGQHIVVSLETGDNFYLHASSKKPKALSKFKGVVIESIAWDRQEGNEISTKEILVGSSSGAIYETLIEGKEKFFKLMYDLHENSPITGLHFERFPPTHTDPTKFLVIAVTPTRRYQFLGGPTFEALFSHSAFATNPGFIELPGDSRRSELHFFSKYQGRAKSFAWSTGPGIGTGNLLFGSQNPGDTVIVDFRLVQYPQRNGESMGPPLSMALTEFHFLLAYEGRFIVMNQLNEEIVFEEIFDQPRVTGSPRGMATDEVASSIWLYTGSMIFEVVIKEEDRHVWKLYLEKQDYETALQFCKDAAQRDKVRTAQADHFFSQGKYDLAATLYAKTRKSFEEVALRFVNVDERDALKTYLQNKRDTLDEHEDATQVTIIATWLTEIYLNKLNQLRDKGEVQACDILLEEFRHFLVENQAILNHATTFNLISSHGRVDELLFYAELIEDYERVISHYVQNREYTKALTILNKQSSADLYYKFSPVLMHHAPKETVDTWMRAPFLKPRKLIPSLMRYDPQDKEEEENQAIRYLRHCVNTGKDKDPAIHNYLISLYAKEEDDAALLNFLKPRGGEIHYDLKYALRLCSEERKTAACVYIYSAMGLYEEAVDLALKDGDIDLAKINANKPEEDEARKRLWLRIAHHVVEEEKDIKKAIEFLADCELLKIEDILPFFPDFVLIDDFKDEICSSLEEYNRHIEELKSAMDDATHSADLIRIDIKDLRNRCGFVGSSQCCDLCDQPVLARPFYLFPCQHVFHQECLTREVMGHLTTVQKMKVLELQQKISSEMRSFHHPKRDHSTVDGVQVDIPKVEQLKADLDEFLASECLFCGELMIRSVDKGFIDWEEGDLVKSWELYPV